jgi:hypothetical protein
MVDSAAQVAMALKQMQRVSGDMFLEEPEAVALFGRLQEPVDRALAIIFHMLPEKVAHQPLGQWTPACRRCQEWLNLGLADQQRQRPLDQRDQIILVAGVQHDDPSGNRQRLQCRCLFRRNLPTSECTSIPG